MSNLNIPVSTQESRPAPEDHTNSRIAGSSPTVQASTSETPRAASSEPANMPNHNDLEAGLPARLPEPLSRRMLIDANAFYQEYKLGFQYVAGFIAITGLILEIRQSAMM
ncbi:hypothetical protein BP5796_09755 [Coleophoma crateriformis]|uniref:Uncharacterized protein n=1 Tax=Coleophoma crateriformis TaxID=565419 RepID=A0A3D8QYX6_9HELO|nr:hypothetical protein BP5796_09755 [Coleophoma crateriformis]